MAAIVSKGTPVPISMEFKRGVLEIDHSDKIDLAMKLDALIETWQHPACPECEQPMPLVETVVNDVKEHRHGANEVTKRSVYVWRCCGIFYPVDVDPKSMGEVRIVLDALTRALTK